MNQQFTEYMLRSLETVTSREFYAGMLFRVSFGVILVLEILALLFVDFSARGDSGNMVAERLDALSILVFMMSTFLAGYWYVFLRLNRERLRALQRAIRSSTDFDPEAFEFFELSRKYSYEVGIGPGITSLARVEPVVWWAFSTMFGFVVLLRLGVIQ